MQRAYKKQKIPIKNKIKIPILTKNELIMINILVHKLIFHTFNIVVSQTYLICKH